MENTSNRFEYAAKIMLFALAAMLPLWFVPWPLGVEQGREITFGFMLTLAGILWILSILTSGSVNYQRSPALYASLLMVLVLGISSFFSKSYLVSLFFAEPASEKFLTVALGALLMLLLGGIFKSRRDAAMAVFLLLLSGSISGILNAVQLLSGVPLYSYLFSFAGNTDFNAVGTVNGLMLFYVGLMMFGVSLVADEGWKKWKWHLKGGLFASLAIFAFNVFLVNFKTSWIVLLGSGIIFFGLIFKEVKNKFVKGKKQHFSAPYVLALTILVVSIVMIMVGKPIFSSLNLPAEVSPSFKATVDIARNVFKEGAGPLLLGSGPGTFGLDWGSYKDGAINYTVLWDARFNQGFSWASTALVTTGILGFLSLLIFFGVSSFVFLRKLLVFPGENDLFSAGVFLSFISIVIGAFLYPANLSLILLLFAGAGLLNILLASPAEEYETEKGSSDDEKPEVKPESFWDIKHRIVSFEGPWTMFFSSLTAIFLLSLGVAWFYSNVIGLRTAVLRRAGAEALSRGEVDKSINKFERALDLENRDYRNHQLLIQARTEKVKTIIQRAASGENVQQEFQSSASAVFQNARSAVELYPMEPALWRTQGNLYEAMIPFIDGAQNLSFSSYKKASELEPLNPSIYADWGRAGLAFADRVQLFINQASSADRPKLEETRMSVLKETQQVLQKAVEIKSDFAIAHFLLAQTEIRIGNIQAAIQDAENAKLAAPFDIGVAFQLGLLYYQDNDLGKAEAEFLRAISINQNYSNARYFLGLIYDRRGEKDKAVAEFEQVLSLNPDNREVQNILENLKSGKDALHSIVPPAEPPEKRKNTPVKEGEEKAEKKSKQSGE